MAFDEKDLIMEDVLFENSTDSDVATEVLFSNSASNGIEELHVNNEDVLEEPLFYNNNSSIEELAPILENEDVFEEKLFANNFDALEEISLAPYDNNSYISEENLSLHEPVSPSSIGEEVLFSEVDEQPQDFSNIDNNPSIYSDELSSMVNGEYASGEKPIYVEKNFAQKILESDGEILKRYDELKNIILLYKGVKSRVSNDFDSFNKGKTQLFKLGFSTKSLKLYLNLDFNEVEPRLKCKDVSHKKAYAQVPVFLRIKSERAMKNAKYLIEKVVKKFDLKENPRAVYVDSVKIIKEKAKTYNK